jgi:sugar/nucleoside kinase (ribokinase family)
VTDGERGCWFAEAGGVAAHVPAYRVLVVDTTGCGDVFHGVYAAALARGAAIREALEAATAAAALKAGQLGAQAGIPTRAAVERFMAEQRGG